MNHYQLLKSCLSAVSLFSAHNFSVYKDDITINHSTNSICSSEILNEYSQNSLDEINKASTIRYSLKKSKVIPDFSDEKYLLNTYYPCGSSVVSLILGKTIETRPFDKTNYEDYSDLHYVPFCGVVRLHSGLYMNPAFSIKSAEIPYLKKQSLEYNKLCKQEKILSASVKNHNTSQKILSNGSSGGGSSTDFVKPISEGEITADYEVPFSYFFKYVEDRVPYPDQYPVPDEGLCEYVATAMLIEYNELFGCKGYLSNQEVERYIQIVDAPKFREAIPVFSGSFTWHLYEDLMHKKTQLTKGNIHKIVDLELSNKPINYEFRAGGIGCDPVNVIKNWRIPDMLCAKFPTSEKDEWHNIIAYGYFDKGIYQGKFLTNYGWGGGWSQCIVSFPFLHLYDCSIRNKSAHQHSYLFKVNGRLACGCGHLKEQ